MNHPRTFRHVVNVTVRSTGSLAEAAQMLREAADNLKRGRLIGGECCGAAGDYEFSTCLDVEEIPPPTPPHAARPR